MSGTIYISHAFADTAQIQLATAKSGLALLGPGTMLASADLSLAGTLVRASIRFPGGSTFDGLLTLDGGGDANAAWVFQLFELTTSSGSKVDVINTGAGPGCLECRQLRDPRYIDFVPGKHSRSRASQPEDQRKNWLR